MKAQVSFEAMVNIALLMIILGVIVVSVQGKIGLLSENVNKEYLENACRKINRATLISWLQTNTTTTASFTESFNLSFNNSYGFTLSRFDKEYLCTLFLKNVFNGTGSSNFSLELLGNLTVHNTGVGVVFS